MTCDADARTLLLYHTLGCHLCEIAAELVVPLAVRHGWSVEQCEIADDDALMERYGVRIPVLRVKSDGRELGWPFDSDQVVALLH